MENLSIGVVGEEMDFGDSNLESPNRKSGRYRQLTPLMKEFLSSRKDNEEKINPSPLKKIISSAIKKRPKLSTSVARLKQSPVDVDGVSISPRSNAVTAVRYGKNVYTHVRMLGGEPPLFQCKFCKRRFTSWSRVRIHLSCKTGVSRFRCEVCSSMWHTKSEYERHLLTHKKPMVVSCPECKEDFQCYLDYTEHSKMMHANQMVDVEVEINMDIPTEEGEGTANKNTAVVPENNVKSKPGRRRHRLKQRSPGGGSRPFKCDQPGCKKDYMNKRHLKRHQLTHSAVPMFQCSLCDKRYRWKTNLTDHVKRDHRMEGGCLTSSPSPSPSPVTRSAELRQKLRSHSASFINPPCPNEKKTLKMKPESSRSDSKAIPDSVPASATALPLPRADVDNKNAKKENNRKGEGHDLSSLKGPKQTVETKGKANPTLAVSHPGDGSDDVLYTLVCSFPREYVSHLMDIVSYEPDPESKVNGNM